LVLALAAVLLAALYALHITLDALTSLTPALWPLAPSIQIKIVVSGRISRRGRRWPRPRRGQPAPPTSPGIRGGAADVRDRARAPQHAESLLARGDVSAQSGAEAPGAGEAVGKAGRAAPAG